ncbi:MAG: hypothetical protein BRC26_01470, partial [Nanohaloarchaea archaeon QH_8_44_6]
DEDVPPPNYDSNGYYKDMQVYEGDHIEEQAANPVSYAFRQANKRGDSESKKDENNDEKEIMECPYCGKEYEMESYYRKHVQKCQEDDKVKKL